MEDAGKAVAATRRRLPPVPPISEEEAVQIRLLMDAMEHIETSRDADSLGRAIAEMHPCESLWWYACAQNRNRPRKVLEALTLMYA